jgi:hypothetical protein
VPPPLHQVLLRRLPQGLAFRLCSTVTVSRAPSAEMPANNPIVPGSFSCTSSRKRKAATTAPNFPAGADMPKPMPRTMTGNTSDGNTKLYNGSSIAASAAGDAVMTLSAVRRTAYCPQVAP